VSVGTSHSKRPRRRTGLPLPKDGLVDDEPHRVIDLLEELGVVEWVGSVVQSAPLVGYLIPYLGRSYGSPRTPIC
jgi:hypothetical protein